MLADMRCAKLWSSKRLSMNEEGLSDWHVTAIFVFDIVISHCTIMDSARGAGGQR